MLTDQRAYFNIIISVFLPLSDEKCHSTESLMCGRSLQLNTEAQNDFISEIQFLSVAKM